MNTLHLELYYKNKTRELAEDKRIKETKQLRDSIDILKEQLTEKYNNRGIAVFYTISDIYLINESRLINNQSNMLDYINKNIRQYPDMYAPYILEHLELNWNESDIQILNKLLMEV
jgi:ABC-type Fe3+ transport system substrate-binding protein